jgi:antitoxin component YwqK of YwqJK toxin-antitoxin module
MTIRMKILALTVLAILILASCKKSRKNPIIINNKRIEGIITADTLYNGLIKEYDVKTNKLLSETEYLNGVLNGNRIEYYSNAKISSMSQYDMGKINGVVSIYDTNGLLVKKDRFYYDMRVGESIEYFRGSVADFSFYSFDRELLMTINYLSPVKKRITDFVDGFFFIKEDVFSEVTVNGISDKKKEFFLYIPNPPEYNFRYSLVLTDSLYHQIKVVKELNAETEPWVRFTTDLSDKRSDKLSHAIRLLISDSIAGGDITMFKKL